MKSFAGAVSHSSSYPLPSNSLRTVLSPNRYTPVLLLTLAATFWKKIKTTQASIVRNYVSAEELKHLPTEVITPLTLVERNDISTWALLHDQKGQIKPGSMRNNLCVSVSGQKALSMLLSASFEIIKAI